MIKLIVEKLPRITKNKKKLERELGVKITNRGKEVFIEGVADKEFVAQKVIEALDFGFPFSSALKITDEDCSFETISIKEYTKAKDLQRVRARIIGKKGKTIKTLCALTNCDLEIKENTLGIIGDAERIEGAIEALIAIIHGSKQGNVYARLEKSQPKPILDLGLKKKNL